MKTFKIMKRVLGLDLGTSSIGWALVNEDETSENSRIIKLGVRIIQYDNFGAKDPLGDFEKGKSLSPNASRTKNRGMRRRLDRYQDRRDNLRRILLQHNIINEDSILWEDGKNTTFETLKLRAIAAAEKISLEQFARVLFAINKKRGYKSNRKMKTTDEGTIIDSMDIAKYLYDNGLTPGQVCFDLLISGKKKLPEFYASDLKDELRKIWDAQSAYYEGVLTDALWEELQGKNAKATWAICADRWHLVGEKRTTAKGIEQKKENYKWRVEALTKRVELEQLVEVLKDINAQINGSSGYLGNISDRSKELYFNKQTIGQYKYGILCKNPHESLQGKVFFRQDYLNEFECIYETQAKYHKELTKDLKDEIRDTIIFYQRKLKSQKGLKSVCELEGKKETRVVNGKEKNVLIGPYVCPQSSPLHQEFKIRQVLNNIRVSNDNINIERELTIDERDRLYQELNLKSKMSVAAAKKLLYGKAHKDWEINYSDDIPGNATNAMLYKCFEEIINSEKNTEYEFDKMPALEVNDIVRTYFQKYGIDAKILDFNPALPMKELTSQPSYMLWHLLYSFVPNDSTSTNETARLEELLQSKFNFKPEHAKIVAKITFDNEYGSLSAKAICNLMPHLLNGKKYSEARDLAGYSHLGTFMTKEENKGRNLADRLQLMPKNSLRNPVVEKILNQMVNVVNSIIDEYGTIDEVRIELARDLKKSAAERQEISKGIGESQKENERLKKEILENFKNIKRVSKNDLIRYKLYKELSGTGHKTLYSEKEIIYEKIFSKDYEIEHIIPKSLLFDDSLSNKTLELSSVNSDKGNRTAYDYVAEKYSGRLSQYEETVKDLRDKKAISYSKMKYLLMKKADIPSDFLNRDISETRYISRKAKEMLLTIVRNVVCTTGSVTSRLREDWQLVNIMQELNWTKYDALGETESFTDKDGNVIRRIKDWTKRNDHRHHAMDALVIAFTNASIIQYLNNLNAHSDKSSSIYAIEQKCLYRNNGKLLFNPPMPLKQFRHEAKRNLESILVSFKAKNTVVTNNVNKIKTKDGGVKTQFTQTPRGQLHNETVYGKINVPLVTEDKINAKFTAEKIATVCNAKYRKALLARLAEYGGDSKKAFTGANSPAKKPIWLDAQQTEKVPDEVKCKMFESRFTSRKPVNKELNVDKVVDAKIKQLLLERLAIYGGKPELAFANLDENPIWVNREKGIALKNVTVFAVNNAEPLHTQKHDHTGKPILDQEGKDIPCDYVQTSNNHHAAIYADAEGNVHERIVSLFEAVRRANAKLPIVDKAYNEALGWEFLFSIKKNEYFVFPNPTTGFDPMKIDFDDPDNYPQISQNLYRVQKFANKDYVFRHHLETTINNDIKDLTFKRIQTISQLIVAVKVRINHTGRIVKVNVE